MIDKAVRYRVVYTTPGFDTADGQKLVAAASTQAHGADSRFTFETEREAQKYIEYRERIQRGDADNREDDGIYHELDTFAIEQVVP